MTIEINPMDKLLASRRETHGDYTENSHVSWSIMEILMAASGWRDGRLNPIQMESLHMFAHKMARIVGGNPDEPDHWKDIGGYAQLVVDRLPKPNDQHLRDLELAPPRVDLESEGYLMKTFTQPVAVPVEDSNRHADRLRRQLNNSELMALSKEDQLRYRWVEGESAYVLQPGRVWKSNFLPETVSKGEFESMCHAMKDIDPYHFYTFEHSKQMWYLLESDHD